MFILDTNTLIYYFKGMGLVATRLLSTPPKELAIPAIVLYELQVGIGKSQSKARIEQLNQVTSLIKLIPFDKKEAIVAANIRVELEKMGKPIGPCDILIAASALANNMTLITHNTAEFSRIENLKLDDWF